MKQHPKHYLILGLLLTLAILATACVAPAPGGAAQPAASEAEATAPAKRVGL
jgi:hypothetical protein